MLSIGMPGTTFRLSRPEAQELRARVRSRVLRAGDVRRARLILMLSEGQSWSAIQQALGCSSAYIARWQARFAQQRLAGLFARHQGRPVSKRTPRLEARILAWTRRAPDDGSTHWSSRKLARALGINHMMVARVWRRAGLKPHRLERHGFEYYRHGTLSLYAALNTRNGEVVGKTAARHTSQEFVAFLAEVVANQPRGKEIHLIADNLSAHKTKRVEQFLAVHSKVHIHYTPTYSSWLNQVENWFARIEREVIARGVFTSVKDLARKLMRYIRHYNRAPRPIKWTYRDPNHRIHANTTSSVTGH